jgi:predicted naringenin-chalcone synthase
MSASSSINSASLHTRSQRCIATDAVDNPSSANVLGLGVALPQLIMQQDEIEHALAGQWRLRGEGLARWRRICGGAGIERRHVVLSLDEVIALSTAERMARYESLAPPLAEHAARNALLRSGLTAEKVTDLVVVSCTGLASPGLDVAIIHRLGLPETVRRTMIGFMGCFGAINGLRSAVGTCAADPSSIVLVVCCELCSLHVRDDPRAENQVACALFGDGAAAAIVAGQSSCETRRIDTLVSERSLSSDDHLQPVRPIGQLTFGHSRLIAASEELMSWRITDRGFAMTLAREVPGVLRDSIGDFVNEASKTMPRAIVPHPGGSGVLDAIESALPRELVSGIDDARAILRTCGNMSSGTILFVLEKMLRESSSGTLPALLLAFGPGLTIESIALLPWRG